MTLVVAFLTCIPMTCAEDLSSLPVKTGEKIVFLGDSITAFGWNAPLGYVKLVVSGLETNGVKVEPIPAGISGQMSSDMLARFAHDVVLKKPDWVTISCGVNDVWHGTNGVELDAYKTNMTAMVDQAQAAKIKVVILTATMIKEEPTHAMNQKLAAYNEFLRNLAVEKKCVLADLNAQMQASIADSVKAGAKPGNLLTADGVHMNPDGNIMMGRGVLKALGLKQTQLDKADAAWLEIPDGVDIKANDKMTLGKFHKLQKVASEQKQSVQQYSDALLAKTLKDAVK